MIYAFTLGYNLVSEITRTTKLLYEQNNRKDFHHIIVDLGFPIVEQGKIPEDLGVAKLQNTIALTQLAQMYGSEYLALPNIGVSQNWTAVCNHINPQDDDIIIGADPDEIPQQEGWLKAMADVITHGGNIELASLINTDQIPVLEKWHLIEGTVQGHRIYLFPQGRLCAWALIGISGKLFKNLGREIPVPSNASRYGWIEHATNPRLTALGYNFCILRDYASVHTIWEKDSLYQDWKNHIVNNTSNGQISFDEFITMKKEGKL